MAQIEALVRTMFEQGFLFAFLGLGVLITFRFFRFPDLTAALLERGVDKAGVRLILGENFLRVLREAEAKA